MLSAFVYSAGFKLASQMTSNYQCLAQTRYVCINGVDVMQSCDIGARAEPTSKAGIDNDFDNFEGGAA